MNTNNIKLKRKIMRRVYGIFAVRVLKHPITLEVVLFGLALMTFAQMVHVKRVIDTFLQIPVANVPRFIFHTFIHGEVLTLIAIGTMVFVALSFPLQLKRLVMPRAQHQVIV